MILLAKIFQTEFLRHAIGRQCAECHWLSKSKGHEFLDYILGFDPWFFV